MGHKTSVVEVEMEDVNDFESLTTCYRKIFKFLLDFAPNISSVQSKSGMIFFITSLLLNTIILFVRFSNYLGAISHDREVEREVAADLESVFPRIGLKAFVQLNSEEKNVQLAELARIVLGEHFFVVFNLVYSFNLYSFPFAYSVRYSVVQ